MFLLNLAFIFCFTSSGLEVREHFSSPCAQALSSFEGEILSRFYTIQILRFDPSRAIHPVELHKISTVMADLQNWILQRATAMGYPIRSVNMLRKVIEQLRSKLNIFTTREELRQVFELSFRQLNGFLFEMLAANRLSELQPIVGATIRGSYLGHGLSSFEGAKELDIVVRGAPDIWLEAKFVSAATLTSGLEQVSLEVLRAHMQAQLKNMIKIRDKINPRIKAYLVISDHLDKEIHTVARELGFEILLLKVPSFRGEDLFAEHLDSFP